MPTLHTVDESFFKTAPVIYAAYWDIPRPAAEVWGELTQNPLYWCRGFKAQWRTPAPHGVGSVKTVKVLGALVADEHYFVWEEGRRKAFFVATANLPLYKTLAEDYLVEPLSDEACRLTWTIAADPTGFGRVNGPAFSGLIGSFFKDTARHFGASTVRSR